MINFEIENYDTLRRVKNDEAEAHKQMMLLYEQIRMFDGMRPKALQRSGQLGKLIRDLLESIRAYDYARTKREQVENV